MPTKPAADAKSDAALLPEVPPQLPVELYRVARRQLLMNQPLRAESAALPANALSVGEAAALYAVGLSTALWRGSASQDPLTQSIADYMALLETSYTTTDAARYLKVDASRIRQRLRERSLYGIDYDGEKRLPRFQFERRHVIPGLREILGALPEQLNPLDVAEWFLSPNPDLELPDKDLPVSPREWLLRGAAVETVAGLARRFE